MQSSSYIPPVCDGQYDIDSISFSEKYTIEAERREFWHEPGITKYSTIQSPGPENASTGQDYPARSLQDGPLVVDDCLLYQKPASTTNTICSRTFRPATATHLEQAPSSLFSPSSTEPCPRISSRSTTFCLSEPHSFQVPHVLAEPSMYAQSSEHMPARHLPPSSHDLALLSLRGDASQRYSAVRDVSPNHLSVASASPPSNYSEDVGDRPHRRRKLSLSSRASSGSSREGSTSDGVHASRSVNRRKTNTPRSRLSSKSRSKESEYKNSLPGSCTFSTFSVSLAALDNEPAGATYMSMVDFQDNSESRVFEHGPTDLPPRQYIGGSEASSPWKPRRNLGTIPGSALDYLPIIENRIERLEWALEEYLRYRSRLALRNSILPGMDVDE